MNTKTIDYCKLALESSFKAYNKDSKIDQSIKDITGMSSENVRHLFNNLGSGIDSVLEVGSFQGSTLCSCLFENEKIKKAVSFENFSEFHSQQNEDSLKKNISNLKNKNVVNIINDDFFNFDLKELGKFDLFFYDGVHTANSQYQALIKAFYSLEDSFIYIVDDWYCPIAKTSEQAIHSINNLPCRISFFAEFPSMDHEKQNHFHGGIGLFVLKKK